MISDPSDGSVKVQPQPELTAGRLKERYGPNWGLKSLDREARAPKPAMTAEELSEYYSKYTLGGKLKERKDADRR